MRGDCATDGNYSPPRSRPDPAVVSDPRQDVAVISRILGDDRSQTSWQVPVHALDFRKAEALVIDVEQAVFDLELHCRFLGFVVFVFVFVQRGLEISRFPKLGNR